MSRRQRWLSFLLPIAQSRPGQSRQPTPSAPSAISTDSASPTTPSGTLPKDPLTPDEAQQLLFICEQYLGKPLSSTEVSKILDLHDIFGFSPSLIEYLVEYSVSGGHKSIHYIEATARAWHQAGCTTVTQAREQVTIYNRAYFKILKAFGIAGRNPVDAEIACMDKWLKDYGFSLEVISEACSPHHGSHSPAKLSLHGQDSGILEEAGCKVLKRYPECRPKPERPEVSDGTRVHGSQTARRAQPLP